MIEDIKLLSKAAALGISVKVDAAQTGEGEEDEELWVEGDPHDMNGCSPTARLTKKEKEDYADFLALLLEYSMSTDSCGDELKSKLEHWFSDSQRQWLEGRSSEDEKAILSRWYELDDEIRYRLTQSFD